jgi:hypothetical protein
MERNRSFRQFLSSLCLLACLQLAVSCSETPAPGPISPIQHTSTPSLAKKGKQEKRIKKKEKTCGGSVSKIIGPKGGKIEHCGHKMVVPEGALAEPREMSITILESEYVDVGFAPANIEFGADGWFNRPVKIAISLEDADLADVDLEELTVVWFDETTQEWVEVEGKVEVHKDKICAWVWHFTQYSLSKR